MGTTIASPGGASFDGGIRHRFANIAFHKVLVACGILASLFYIAMNIITPMLYPGYNPAAQTVSELSAIDTPTRPLWSILAMIYSILIIAFGWGIMQSAGKNRPLRFAGGLLILYSVFGMFWPPMHQREVLAADGETWTDTLHIVWTMITVPLMLLVMGFGSVAFGRRFRYYSIGTMVVMLVFGFITGMDAPKISGNLPTPYIGIWERISIAAFIVWVAVLSGKVLKDEKTNQATTKGEGGEGDIVIEKKKIYSESMINE